MLEAPFTQHHFDHEIFAKAYMDYSAGLADIAQLKSATKEDACAHYLCSTMHLRCSAAHMEHHTLVCTVHAGAYNATIAAQVTAHTPAAPVAHVPAALKRGGAQRCAASSALRAVFATNIAIVTGPIPPGTGVIAPATCTAVPH